MPFSDVRIKNIDLTVRYTPQSMGFSAKNRRNHIIGIQLSGSAWHYFSDRSFLLESMCVYFFNQEEDYDVQVLEKGLAFSVHFTTYEPIDQRSFCAKIHDVDAVVRQLENIEQQFARDAKCTARSLSDLYRLLDNYRQIYQRRYRPQDDRMGQAREYIHIHFREGDCLEVAAKLSGVTRRRFNDLFRAHFGTTPNAYLIGHRISLAQKLLAAKELSVSEAAELCGYGDIYYFSKQFKQVTGMTPSSYKKML